MTQMYIGLSITSNEFTEPTTGTSSSTATDVEVRISATAQLAGITRTQLGNMLEVIENFVLAGGLAGAGANIPKL